MEKKKKGRKEKRMIKRKDQLGRRRQLGMERLMIYKIHKKVRFQKLNRMFKNQKFKSQKYKKLKLKKMKRYKIKNKNLWNLNDKIFLFGKINLLIVKQLKFNNQILTKGWSIISAGEILCLG